ncbi:Uncharacterized protein APZ42_016837 [Daphnia magna]|uniref:Uncharacterized protein n=1 Tax=Daphnia magna TaxID=35525 RepID=A0A165A6L0_9CRUS|nr:Uncharacterized protein APZ42_016837 [Daphnia magna]
MKEVKELYEQCMSLYIDGGGQTADVMLMTLLAWIRGKSPPQNVHGSWQILVQPAVVHKADCRPSKD